MAVVAPVAMDTLDFFKKFERQIAPSPTNSECSDDLDDTDGLSGTGTTRSSMSELELEEVAELARSSRRCKTWDGTLINVTSQDAGGVEDGSDSEDLPGDLIDAPADPAVPQGYPLPGSNGNQGVGAWLPVPLSVVQMGWNLEAPLPWVQCGWSMASFPLPAMTHVTVGQPFEFSSGQQGSLGSFPCSPPALDGNDQKESTLLTTLMLRNIPNNYDSDGLLALLDSQGFAGQYTFVYLPCDLRTRAALGYAFVDFVSPAHALRAFQVFDKFANWKGKSRKTCNVQWSRTQGLTANFELVRLRTRGRSSFKDVPEGLKPVVFQNGVRMTFPATARSN